MAWLGLVIVLVSMLGLIFSMKENALCAQSDSGNTHTSHNHWKTVAAAAAARNADCVWLTGIQSNQKHIHHKYCLLTGSAYLNIPPSRSRCCVCLSPPVPMQNIENKKHILRICRLIGLIGGCREKKNQLQLKYMYVRNNASAIF